MSQSPKPPSLISLRLGGKRGKTCKTSYDKKGRFYDLIYYNKEGGSFISYEFFILKVVWNSYDGGIC